MMEMLQKWLQFVREHQLFSPRDKILLGVSGGIDSIVMLDLFLRISHQQNLKLAVVHVNHQLRGRSADADERFVRNLATDLNLPFYGLKSDVRSYCQKHRLSIETGAREVRFHFLNRILKRIGFDVVALAHHADDQAETILMHLIQGSGLRGLRGMLPKRDRIIRPLLSITRGEIENYCVERKLKYTVDTSNYETRYIRNKIRWDVLHPLKKHVGKSVVPSICHAASIVSESESYLNSVVDKIRKHVIISRSEQEIVLDIDRFLHYFKAVQKALLIHIFEEFFRFTRNLRTHEFDRIINLAKSGKSGSYIEIGNQYRIVRTKKQLALIRNINRWLSIPVEIGREISLPECHLKFHAEILNVKRSEITFANNKKIEYLDLLKIPSTLCIRSMEPGDWFVPLGMQGKKKLHDFFIDEKVPFYKRSSIPLLVGGDSIVWVMGHRLDERFKLDTDTKKILKVEIQEPV